jgi:hypothetical protein
VRECQPSQKANNMSEQLEQKEDAKIAREPAPDGWGYDWRGVLVDLQCMRPGEDGIPPVFLSKIGKDE